MPLPLVYHDDYSPPFPANHRFPMEKFRLLHDHLIASGVTSASELLRQITTRPLYKESTPRSSTTDDNPC